MVANFTKGDLTYDSATGNWTVKWHIPYNVYNATGQSGYKFRILANFAEDVYGNKGPASDSDSSEFKVTSAVITVTSISTTQSSYARGTTVYVQFTASYPDGSVVTSGKANITLTLPDSSTTTIIATYSTDIGKFQATYYLDFTAQLGTWTATLAVNALNDTKDVTPRWYPGNVGPLTAVNTTFTVTESTLLLEINATVTDIEAKLDNSVYGLSAIKNAINQVQTTLNAVALKVDAIYTEITNNTYGLAAIKGAISGLDVKLGAFNGTDTAASLLYEIKASVQNITATVDFTPVLNAISGLDAKLGNFTGTDTVATLLYNIKTSVSAINWADITSILTKVTSIEDKILLAPSELKFDFGTATSLWEHDYIQITETTAYSADTGYGWTNTSGLYSRDRGAPDLTRRDFVFSSLNRTFKIDLSNGNYTVIITMGDQLYAHDLMQIYAEGDLKANVTTPAGTFAQIVFPVSVTDGSLELTFVDAGGIDSNWVINALIVQRSWK
jgi:hypothetical protein